MLISQADVNVYGCFLLWGALALSLARARALSLSLCLSCSLPLVCLVLACVTRSARACVCVSLSVCLCMCVCESIAMDGKSAKVHLSIRGGLGELSKVACRHYMAEAYIHKSHPEKWRDVQYYRARPSINTHHHNTHMHIPISLLALSLTLARYKVHQFRSSSSFQCILKRSTNWIAANRYRHSILHSYFVCFGGALPVCASVWWMNRRIKKNNKVYYKFKL